MQSHRTPVLAVLAALGFLLTLTIHLLTYTPLDLGSFVLGAIVIPFVGMFPLFAAMLFDLRARSGTSQFSPAQFRSLSMSVPRWGRLLFVGVFIYVGINFIVCSALTHGGQPMQQNGVDVLVSHGVVIATLTPAEYVQQQSYYIRLFTGHPLIFSLAPALYFRFIAAR